MKETWINNRIINYSLILLGVFAGLIAVYKAATLSFTHDESGTFLYLNQLSPWQILIHESAWQSANNHILNTVLYKISIHLFGHSDFILRLPNVLAYWGCLLTASWVINNKLSKPVSKIVLFLILFFNPYILDFYSLCRGYGLSMFFHFSFLICIWRFKDKQNVLLLYLAFALLSLASLSLLTNLILFPIYTIGLWLGFKSQKISIKVRNNLILAPLIFGLITLVLVLKPLLYLIGKNELKFGVASIWDSLKSFTTQTFYYIPKQDFMWVHDVLTIILLIAITTVLYFSLKDRKNAFLSLSFILLIIALYILYLGFDIRFPSERKTTIYIPILALIFSNHLDRLNINQLRQKLYGVVAFCACILLLFSNKLDRTIEWKYDRKTKDYMLLTQETASEKSIVLLAEWWFTPTAEYYVKTLELKNIVLLPYKKSFDLNDNPNMVIAHTSIMLQRDKYHLIESDEELGLFVKK